MTSLQNQNTNLQKHPTTKSKPLFWHPLTYFQHLKARKKNCKTVNYHKTSGCKEHSGLEVVEEIPAGMLNNVHAELIRQYMHLMSKWEPSPGNWGFCEPGDQQRKLAESPTNGKVNRLTRQTKPKSASSDHIRLIFSKKKIGSSRNT